MSFFPFQVLLVIRVVEVVFKKQVVVVDIVIIRVVHASLHIVLLLRKASNVLVPLYQNALFWTIVPGTLQRIAAIAVFQQEQLYESRVRGCNGNYALINVLQVSFTAQKHRNDLNDRSLLLQTILAHEPLRLMSQFL